jgi:hypothetical protein
MSWNTACEMAIFGLAQILRGSEHYNPMVGRTSKISLCSLFERILIEKTLPYQLIHNVT